MAALTDAVLSSRRQQNPIWDSDTWSCPDPQRCVRCDCAITSPSTPGAGVVNFVLDNRAADCEDEDGVCSLEDDAERWFLVGCKRPYQYQPLVKGGGEFDVDHEDGDNEVEEELAVLLLEDKMTLLLPVDEDER
ncbi:hypothetical protein L798_09286 [Zootermopsis nevadensis]|nr:hypothetical protein L798_09286 [Zootermopsis nevadensis]